MFTIFDVNSSLNDQEYTPDGPKSVTACHTQATAVIWLGLPRVPGINYPGNFLLPDGYPGSEYLIFRIYLIGFSSIMTIILNNFLLFFV